MNYFDLNQCKNWIKYHESSEELASEAQINSSKEYYDKAAQEELKALANLSNIAENQSRTLSIIAVSAVSLLFKAGKVEEAKVKAIQWMADDRILESFRDDLKEFLR